MATQLWVFPVQWRDRFSVTVEFKTEIISSEAGKEQRRAMRAYPRRALSFKLDALPAVIDEVQFFLASAQRNTVVMPEPVRRQRTVSGLSEGQSSVTVDALADWMREGSYVALVGSGRSEIFTIAQIDGTTLFFSSPSPAQWPSNSRICPAWPGLLSESIRFSLPTDRVMQGSIEFAVTPGSELISGGEARFQDYLYGRELFSFRTNWKDSPEVTYTQERKVIDYGRGVTAMFTSVQYASEAYAIDVLNFSPFDANRLTDFFCRMKGRQGEFFFIPPATPKMRVAEPYIGGGNLIVEGFAAKQAFDSNTAFRILAIRMGYGTTHYRKVVAAAATGGGATSLSLGRPINELISADTVKSIRWVVLARMETDDLTIDWETTQVSTARVVVHTLEYVEPDEADTFDEGTRWLIEYFGAEFVDTVIFGSTFRVLNEQEPRFALVVDAGTQYLINSYGRGVSDELVLSGTDRVLNVIEPRFAGA